jgi:hypothetical protein
VNLYLPQQDSSGVAVRPGVVISDGAGPGLPPAIAMRRLRPVVSHDRRHGRVPGAAWWLRLRPADQAEITAAAVILGELKEDAAC